MADQHIEWRRLFPEAAAERMMVGLHSPDDEALIRAAVVQGMLQGLYGAFRWHEYLMQRDGEAG